MKRAIAVLLAFLFLVKTIAANAEGLLPPQDSFGTHHATFTSSYMVHNRPLSGEIRWIDNERIVFAGYEVGVEEVLPNGSRSLKQGIYIFDIRTSTGTRYADGILKCFNQGFIRYEVTTPKSITVREGVLGHETPQHAAVSHRAVVNPFSCKAYPPEAVPWIHGRLPKLLFEEHGYLNVTSPPRNWDQPVMLIKGADSSVVLPFTQREMSFPAITYSPYHNAYLLYDRSASEVPDRTNRSGVRSIGAAKKLYVLRPDGSYESISIPYHPWHRGLGKFYLARSGIVMVSRARDSKSNPLRQEIFLIHGNTWESLLRGGETSNGAVSPDGCKLAIGMQAEGRSKENPLLRVMNLCKEGKRQ